MQLLMHVPSSTVKIIVMLRGYVSIDYNIAFHLHQQQMKKLTAANTCTSVADHFDGHVDVLKQCMWHLTMQHGQGHTR